MATKGTINIRVINNKKYYYHQYLEDGKQVSKTISESEAYSLAMRIYYPGNSYDEFINHKFNYDVSYGSSLINMSNKYSSFNRRFCFDDIQDFFSPNKYIGKVLVLYGLRRTGKTTLMFQTINSFSLKDFAKTAYIKCSEDNTFYKLLDDIKYLTSCGFKYIFIDEVTLLEDFIALSSTLSDVYGLMAKIVLSGTDSLGFMIAKYHELYDRTKMIHTTYIPFKEFSTVLGINSIDTYIEYGGTMSIEGVDYNNTILVNKERVNEYVDSAIAHNIIHSLKVYKDGEYFSSLLPLYEKGELENVINRIIEDTNHRFIISIIERSFKSHDYGSLKQLLTLPRNSHLSDVLKNVDEKKLTDDLMKALNIINVEKSSQKVDENVLNEVKDFLLRLDVLSEVDEVRTPTFSVSKRNVFTQPGLRYNQAKVLLDILFNDSSISSYNTDLLSAIKDKLLSDVKGKMIEDMVLLETSLSKKAFKMIFDIRGEYDMAILDEENKCASIFEIKYSNTTSNEQGRYLKDQELAKSFELKYYPIKEKIILYRGENTQSDDIKYINIEEFLNNL